jgi:hypothetical protein
MTSCYHPGAEIVEFIYEIDHPLDGMVRIVINQMERKESK